MPISNGGSSPQLSELGQIKQLNEENKSLIQELEERTKKIHNFIKWQRVLGILKLLIIVIPLVLSIIYLPAILQNFIAPYQELLGGAQELNDANKSLDINALLKGL